MELPEIGGRIGPFEIVERLGDGGMGVVYKARDVRLGRPVALKLMSPSRERQEEARRRFLREARAIAALDHPNVCPLYEIGEAPDGRTFLAMALCPGETLRSLLRRGPLAHDEALRIAAQVADGLEAAHAHGIVHRDIKPSNLMVCGGTVRILDFGVAQLSHETTITREGAAVGTLHYTAPEQLFGERVGPAADLWSLGVVLYETIAGRLPFPGKCVSEVLLTVIKKAPEPLEAVSPEVWKILRKALARSPQDRFPSAAVMRDALLLAISGTGTEPGTGSTFALTPPRERQRSRLQNLPFPPLGDLLKGRAEDLAALGAALNATEGDELHALVLHGLGGIGKTRLAIEHAWNQRQLYSATLFVLADSPEGLSSGLASLARPDLLDLPEREAAAEHEVVGAVLRRLHESPGWLLILDNVDSHEALLAVSRLLPALTGGHVLITSRCRDWPAGVQRQALDVIQPAPATDFLLKRTIKDRHRQPDDVSQALRLAELLDGLPLALEQAAAYIAHTQMSFAEYLEVWEQECDSALGWYDEGVMQYPASLAVTWQRTFRQLSPTAQALLRLAAHLAPDPIPVEMLEAGAGILGEAALRSCAEVCQRPVREDLAELAAFSLIARHGPVFRVHRVVQEALRQRIPEEERTAWVELALTLVGQYAPFQADDVNTWPVWDLLRPHAMQILAHAAERGIPETVPAGRLMTEVSLLLYAKGLYPEAEPFMRQALELDGKLFGVDHPEVAVDLNNLALLLEATDRLEEAEPLIRRALEIDRASFGDQHPTVARDLNALALLLMATGSWAEAEGLVRRALIIDQGAYRGEHPAVARDLHNLAHLLSSTRRTAEAEPLIRRALQISKMVNGTSHPSTARKLQILAGVLRGLGKPAEAEPLARQALELFERSLGPDHRLTKSARRDFENFSRP